MTDASSFVYQQFITLLALDNPSGHEDAIRAYIKEQLSNFGLLTGKPGVLQQDEIGNVLFTLTGQAIASAKLFCAHTDSVPPCQGITYTETKLATGQTQIQAAGKTILGADDRAGMAVMLALLEWLAKQPPESYPVLEFLFTAQEEVGIKGARALDLSWLKSEAAYVLDGEGPVGVVFNQGPARSTLKLELIGKASHAGIAPEAGLNSIMILGRFLALIPPSGRIDTNTTWNLGKVDGGKALNVVADNCVIEAEFRSLSQQKLDALIESVEAAIQKLSAEFPDLKVNADWTHQYPAFVVEETQGVVEKSIEAARLAGLSPSVEPMAIGSDAHILNLRGLPSVVWGMGFMGSHSVTEKITVESLQQVCHWAQQLILLK